VKGDEGEEEKKRSSKEKKKARAGGCTVRENLSKTECKGGGIDHGKMKETDRKRGEQFFAMGTWC